MVDPQQSLDSIQDIKRMMERSSRFLSLSGLSGIFAGIIALVACYFAYQWIQVFQDNAPAYSMPQFRHALMQLEWDLALLAGAVLIVAIAQGLFFTWRKAKKEQVSMWDSSSRRLLINLLIPLVAGGVFVLAMIREGQFGYIAPVFLIFYGLALVNGSKYTWTEVRSLGLLEIMLGLVNLFYIGYGLVFWAIGFGILHILYGVMMWWKYDRV
jgi:hypothetical protein